MCICLLDKDAFTTLTRPSRPEGMTAADRSSVCAAPISAKSDWFPFPSRLTVTSAVTFVSAVIFSATLLGNIAQIDGGDAVARILMDGLPAAPTHAAVSDPEPAAYTVSVALSPSATAGKTSSLDASPAAAA